MGIHDDAAVFKATAYERIGMAQLPAHVAETYGVEVTGTRQLDGGVLAVERGGAPPWVARLFQRHRPLDVVRGDAEVLQAIEADGIPAERCVPDPVSQLGDEAVMVTELVEGRNLRGDERPATYRRLGELLAQLHAIDATTDALARAAGSWHSLSFAGGGRGQDVQALLSLLADVGRTASESERAALASLASELRSLDVGDGLPVAFTHPDFGPPNAIETPTGDIVLVDWAGAGTAPRTTALGMLLSCTGGNEALVQATVDGYRSGGGDLEPEELARLTDAVRGFGLVLSCWGVLFFGTPPSHVLMGVPFARSSAEAIAASARAAFAAPRPVRN